MTLTVDHHARFKELLLDGANGGVPRDLAVHALACRECTTLASSLASLTALDLDGAVLPAQARAPIPQAIATPFTPTPAAPAPAPAAMASVASDVPDLPEAVMVRAYGEQVYGAPTQVDTALPEPTPAPAFAALAGVNVASAPSVPVMEPVAPASEPPAPTVPAIAASATPAAPPGLAALGALNLSRAPAVGRAGEPVAARPAAVAPHAPEPAAAALARLNLAAATPLPIEPKPEPQPERAAVPHRRRTAIWAPIAAAAMFLLVAGALGAALLTRDGDQLGAVPPAATPTPTQSVLSGGSTPEPTPEATRGPRRAGGGTPAKPLQTASPLPSEAEKPTEAPTAGVPAEPTPTPTPFVAQPPPPPPPLPDNPPPTQEPDPTPSATATEPPPPPTPAPVSIAISDASSAEGNNPLLETRTLNFTVSLSAASSSEVRVSYATAGGAPEDGLATEGNDYAAASGQLVFAPGETSKTITVQINEDVNAEPQGDFGDETMFVNLSAPLGHAVISDAQGVGTIRDDDVL